MSLVSAKELSKAIQLDKLGFLGQFVGWSIHKALRLSVMNEVYDRNKHLCGVEFLESLLNDFNVNYTVEGLENLPKEGAYITISNHPLGGLDGILLVKIMLEQNPEYKILANFLLEKIAPLKPYIFSVNPFENHQDVQSSTRGLKETLKHLKEGRPLGIFPAGEVSTIKDGNSWLDKSWENSSIKLVKKAKTPIIPIYFEAKNSKLFYKLAAMNDLLRTALLPSEMLKQKKKKITIKIGKPISIEEQNKYQQLGEFTEMLREKTYNLSDQETDNTILPVIEEIVSPADKSLLVSEIETLREDGSRLLISKNFEVFLAKTEKIKNLLYEIGRLREITFREVGEGTNQSIDLDHFDEYFQHLILWDNETSQVAGAYRMGIGHEIYPVYGINGFYITGLFDFDEEVHPLIRDSIEMGRAFVIKEYQQKPMPLFLLWKGIFHTTFRYPTHKYLIGGVSISNRFSESSKSIILEYLKRFYLDTNLTQHIHPKVSYTTCVELKELEEIFKDTGDDLTKFDKLVAKYEAESCLRLPVLIKKYIKQNARVLSFNVDPLFNNAIDALMFIDIEKIPESTINPVKEEYLKDLETRS